MTAPDLDALAALRAENERLTRERDEAQRSGVIHANYWKERAELAEDQRERTRDVWASRAERAEARAERLAAALRELVACYTGELKLQERAGTIWAARARAAWAAACAALAGEDGK